jgi:PadR family transcriptional regulator, regulatory protein PadR
MIDYTQSDYWLGLIKMSTSRYFVLHALSIRPMHGYEISKWVGEITGGCCSPTEGGLYPMLKEFEQGGYVDCNTEIVSGRARKVYMLNEKGREAYNIAAEAWTGAAMLILKSRGLVE